LVHDQKKEVVLVEDLVSISIKKKLLRKRHEIKTKFVVPGENDEGTPNKRFHLLPNFRRKNADIKQE